MVISIHHTPNWQRYVTVNHLMTLEDYFHPSYTLAEIYMHRILLHLKQRIQIAKERTVSARNIYSQNQRRK